MRCRILPGKPEGQRLLERVMCVGYESLSLINLDENRENCQAVVRMTVVLQVL
jgi:hypothetical protein